MPKALKDSSKHDSLHLKLLDAISHNLYPILFRFKEKKVIIQGSYQLIGKL